MEEKSSILTKEERLLSILGVKKVDSIDVGNVDGLKSSKYREHNIVFLKDNSIVIKNAVNPSLIKIKQEENAVEIYLVPEKIFNELQSHIVQSSSTEIDFEKQVTEEEDNEDGFDSTAASKLLYEILFAAKIRGVSDIHILPKKGRTVVKFREDGNLKIFKEYQYHYCKYLINKIKTGANLNITNKQTPQDGKFKTEVDGEVLELRVSTANTVFGENAVIRVQQTTSLFNITLDDLGFEPEDLSKYRSNFKNPYGMILNVGATGQGKTTTFYLTINELFNLFPDKNISTVEDPVEIIFEDANQFEVNDARGNTFAKLLKALLRQDPDIILIGEIRDEETASIAVKAAMTGHLVLATLHATDAINAFPRLRDIGISPQQMSSTVSCILSQRLLRKLCKCKRAIPVNDFLRKKYHLTSDTIYEPVGCPACLNSGFKGRAAILEVFEVDEVMKIALSQNKSEIELKQIAKNLKFQNLWKNGLKKVNRGETSISEVERVVKPDAIYDSEGE